MKPILGLRACIFCLSASLGLLLCGAASATVTFSISPAAVSSQYSGFITLEIDGIVNAGDTVQVDKYLDINNTGVIDSHEPLMQSFQVTDGQATTYGGVTNGAVPGDSNPVSKNITAKLSFSSIGFDHLVGQYLLRVSSPTGNFTPVTNVFNVTNTPFGQSFSGSVINSGTNVPNAAVLLLVAAGGKDHQFVGGTVANSLGNYSISVPPGTFLLTTSKSNFVGNFSSPLVTIGAGQNISTNLFMSNTTATISATIEDIDTSAGLPAVNVTATSDNGLLAVAFAHTNGGFVMPVTASTWKLNAQSQSLDLLGYVGYQNSTNIDTTTNSVSGLIFGFPKATAMIYGRITDNHGNPLAGVRLYGNDNANNTYQGDACTDTNGNYFMGLVPSTWDVEVDSGASPSQWTNYVFSQAPFGQNSGTNITAGMAVRQDFIGILATNQITGIVTNNSGAPVANLQMIVTTANPVNGTNYIAAQVSTDVNGHYTVLVTNGVWNVGFNCGGDNGSPGSQGYQCPNPTNITIANNNGVANFVLFPCGPLQIITNLPNGYVNEFYSNNLAATGCNPPFNWMQTGGSLSGLTLYQNGQISGFLTTLGTLNFTVQVTDNNNNSTSTNFSITVGPALQITTTSLPDANQNQYYSNNLSAIGGEMPYTWALSPGNFLPSGMSLSPSGVLSGTPGTSGFTGFNVQVTDGTSTTANTNLSLNVIAAPVLQITNNVLPNATDGSAYNLQLGALGGNPPYQWSLSPGSDGPPPALSLATNGLISGNPDATNGTYYFWARVTDSHSFFTDALLQMNVFGTYTPPVPMITGAHWLGNGEFQYGFNTSAGVNYTIYASTNLSNWFPIGSFTGSGGPFTIDDYSAANNARRFYRVKAGP